MELIDFKPIQVLEGLHRDHYVQKCCNVAFISHSLQRQVTQVMHRLLRKRQINECMSVNPMKEPTIHLWKQQTVDKNIVSCHFLKKLVTVVYQLSAQTGVNKARDSFFSSGSIDRIYNSRTACVTFLIHYMIRGLKISSQYLYNTCKDTLSVL